MAPITPPPPRTQPDTLRHCGEECSEGHVQAGRCTQPPDPTTKRRPPRDPRVEGTPEDFVHEWQQASSEERLDLARQLLTNARAGDRCLFIGHKEQIKYLTGKDRPHSSAQERLELARQALLRDGYFRPDEVGDDVAPRITERLTALCEELAEAQRHAAGWEGKYFEMVEKYTPLAKRLDLADTARRAKEHQLDDIRRALCDVGLIEDDDPYSHADLADVIRQTLNDLPDQSGPQEPPCLCGHPADGHGLDPVLCRDCYHTPPTQGLRYHAEHLHQTDPASPGVVTRLRTELAEADSHSAMWERRYFEQAAKNSEVRAAHPRGPGLLRTPSGMLNADDVCGSCHVQWPCPTGRILTQHTTPQEQL